MSSDQLFSKNMYKVRMIIFLSGSDSFYIIALFGNLSSDVILMDI